MKELEDTFTIEIKRLHLTALKRPLEPDEINKLVKLTTAWKSYANNQISQDLDGLAGLSDKELLELVRG